MDGSAAVTEAGCGRAPGFEPGRETEKDSLAQREPVTFVLFCSFLLIVSFFFWGGREREGAKSQPIRVCGASELLGRAGRSNTDENFFARVVLLQVVAHGRAPGVREVLEEHVLDGGQNVLPGEPMGRGPRHNVGEGEEATADICVSALTSFPGDVPTDFLVGEVGLRLIVVRFVASLLLVLLESQISLAESAAQQVVEALVVLVALRAWKERWLHQRVTLRVKSDNISALVMCLKLKTTGHGTGIIARELALDIACSEYRPQIAEHIPGVDNVISDALSRRYQPGADAQLPHCLCKVQELVLPARGEEFFRSLGNKPPAVTKRQSGA